jgi:hypothetical protein
MRLKNQEPHIYNKTIDALERVKEFFSDFLIFAWLDEIERE